MGWIKWYFFLLLSGGANTLSAQDTLKPKPFTFSGYIETYYGYDFAKPKSGTRPFFIYNHHKHNEVNVNLVYVKFAYSKNCFRFNLAPMLGTYSQSNLAGEPFYLRQIFEANLGVKLLKKKELWLDAGVFPSHIGFESAISKDCPTLSRSILAENSPYFETGLKLSYIHSPKLSLALLVLNGWQKIYWRTDKSLPSFGTQITFTPGKKLVLNYSTFIGTDEPDSIRRMCYFHNLYAVWYPFSKLSFTLGFDIGTMQKSKHNSQYHLWYSPVIIVRHQPLKHFAMALRYEYYHNKNGAVISAGASNGIRVHGLSLNLDCIISPKVSWRTEGKMYRSKEAVFELNNVASSFNFSLLTSLAISLSN